MFIVYAHNLSLYSIKTFNTSQQSNILIYVLNPIHSHIRIVFVRHEFLYVDVLFLITSIPHQLLVIIHFWHTIQYGISTVLQFVVHSGHGGPTYGLLHVLLGPT